MKNQYVGDIFDREPVAKQFDRADPAIKNILLEPVPGDFSVCKVPGYTGVDFAKTRKLFSDLLQEIGGII